jgi:hypothetical protein
VKLLNHLGTTIEEIDRRIEELHAAKEVLLRLSGDSEPAKPTRTISPAGRKSIARAQRKRWAELKAAKKKQKTASAKKG